MEKAQVKNAADEDQVLEAGDRQERARKRELGDLKSLLSTIHGRRFLWRLMGKCKTFETIWSQSAAIHYNAGQQDIGHFLMSEIMQADQDAFFQMMKEAKGDLYV